MNALSPRALALAAALGLATLAPAQAAEYKTIDPAASRIGFTYTQMGVAVDGHFGSFDARLNFDPAKPQAAKTVLELRLASIDTGSAEADSEVRGKAWFDTAAHPVARFESTSVKALGGNRFEVHGTLSIKGRSREVVAPLAYAAQGDRAAFDGSFVLKRADFGIGEGEWADFGIVANDITVNFHIVAAQ
jgi:polyisoprenoid-binding protein YceI